MTYWDILLCRTKLFDFIGSNFISKYFTFSFLNIPFYSLIYFLFFNTSLSLFLYLSPTCFLCTISFYSLILTFKSKTSNILGQVSRPFEYCKSKKRMPFGSSASLTSCMILSKQYTITAVYRNVFPLKFHWKILNYMHHKITRCAVSR